MKTLTIDQVLKGPIPVEVSGYLCGKYLCERLKGSESSGVSIKMDWVFIPPEHVYWVGEDYRYTKEKIVVNGCLVETIKGKVLKEATFNRMDGWP